MFDNIDHFVNAYIMLILGILECTAIGWFYEFDETVKKLGRSAALIAGVGYWVSLLSGVAIGFHFFEG